jgi:hypothetical protein
MTLQHPYPLHGCNSDLAQYSNPPRGRIEDSGSAELAEVLSAVAFA